MMESLWILVDSSPNFDSWIWTFVQHSFISGSLYINCHLRERFSQTLMNYAATFCYLFYFLQLVDQLPRHHFSCQLSVCWELIDYTEISVSKGHLCAQLKWQRGMEKMLFHWESKLLLDIIKLPDFSLFYKCFQGLWRCPLVVLFSTFYAWSVAYEINPINFYFSAQMIGKHIPIVTIRCSWERISFPRTEQNSAFTNASM